MNPLSVYNAMYYDSRIKGATMIIDVGAENTDLIIAEGESIWLRSISIGGNAFTEALSKSFKVNFEKAEDLKRNAAEAQKPLIETEEAKKTGLGTMTTERWNELSKQLVDLKVLQKAVDGKECFIGK